MRTAFFLLLSVFTASPLSAQPASERVESKGGIVVCVSPPAAEIGAAILKKGGNAVDAAVAVGFAMAVTWPEAGNIGGGGFMMVAIPGKEPTCIEYREMAPATAKVDLFADGKVSGLDHKAAGVPGTVRGLALAHEKFGKLTWKDVVLPAVKLAEDGFTVNAVLATGLNRVLTNPKTTNAEFKRVYGKPDGTKWQAGDMLVLKDLGRTLRSIAEKGGDAFYTGESAELLDKEMKAAGGLIAKTDLTAYRAKERKPISTTYRGFTVYGPPPPSSGGVCLTELLNILENYDLKKLGQWNPETSHLMIEAMKRGYADRARYLGDPDFVVIPNHLTTKDYAKKLVAGIDLAKATPSDLIAPEIVLDKESDSTTHFS
ncbi:MAG TPA: gamma-glutamyltransferase, partial [Gemmata sp.]|nr:gamma-glutamyltransferase [Gemmata sp.]